MEDYNLIDTTNCFPLSELKIGKSAFIRKIDTEESMHRRLLDLGMTSGVKITCLLSAPFGDPKEYLIRGTVIGLRNEDAEKIYIFNN